MKLTRLTNHYNELTNLEKKIVAFITEYPNKVVTMTSRDLGEKLYISKTTIINLSKKLEFEGFSELKYYVKDSINKEKEQHEEKNTDITFKDILYSIEEEVVKTLGLQNEEDLRNLCKAVVNSKTLYIISRGASKPFGSYLSSRLAMLKIRAIFVDDMNLIDILVENIEKDETVLLLSLSGNTYKVNEIAKAAFIKGSTVISLTSFSDSKLQKHSNITMYCYAQDTETKYYDFRSRIGMHALIQIIISYTKNLQETKEDEKNDNLFE